jgi:hypothetical protein
MVPCGYGFDYHPASQFVKGVSSFFITIAKSYLEIWE